MTLIEEMISAGRGLALILIGRRDATDNFDLSQRGLLGSFVALLVAALVDAGVSAMMGGESTLPFWAGIIASIVLWLFQCGGAALALTQMRRTDGLLPYLQVFNWMSFYSTVIAAILIVAGLDPLSMFFVFGLVSLIVLINIARIVVTLTPLQIASFIIAQLVCAMIGTYIMGLFLLPVVPAAG